MAIADAGVPMGDGTERRVDWLELFFDVVFVVVIGQLTRLLAGTPGVTDFLLVIGILVPSWLVWINITIFVNQGISARTRIPVLIAMASTGLIAVGIPEVAGAGAPLFALGYSAAKLAIWPLWVRARRQSGEGAILPTIYGPGLAVLWIASIAVPDGIRLAVWAVLVLVELGILASGLPRSRFAPHHLIERFSLFTMIVLGEGVIEVILAIRIGQPPEAWVIAGLGFALLCGFWLMYFVEGARVAERTLGHGSSTLLRDVLGVGHYFIILGLIGVAAGLGAAIEEAADPHLQFSTLVALCGGTAVYHLAQVLTAWRYGLPTRWLLSWGVLSLAVSIIVIATGEHWQPWIVLAVMLADTLLHAATGPLVARRLKRTA